MQRPDGSSAEEYVVLTTSSAAGVDPSAPGLVTLGSATGRVLAWRFPDDPALPGLAPACDPVRAATLLPRGPLAGADPGGPAPAGVAPVGVALVGYRPLRRAVVRIDHEGSTSWAKVLRTAPGARGGWSDVRRRLHLLADAGVPVPAVAAEHEALGVLVLDPLPGIPLLDAVVADDAHGVEVDDLVALLEALPPGVRDLPARPAWSDRARQYAASLAGTSCGERAHEVAEAVRRRSTEVDLGPVVPAHGDLHEGQLTADREGDRPGHRWRLRGLLDVDTVGPGHRVDDLACLVAHALALGPAGSAVADRWRTRAGTLVGAEALDVRTAGVLLSLAVGAHDRARVGAPQTVDAAGLLDLAEAALAGAVAQPSSR
ncbi:phosphotransferase [Phycicoccus sonneratiae]|uniref:Phosphotransferase n=1 Tax=Phycicoccus sonneratiae TaxID=2807628 RepID=A0ABS2CN82_9MICO|nr:phosphotransferase [Phycicoccus sonneraticus]MBM6401345.1 phosphotransferase [Phycicoccus sonneraticus]